MAIHIKTSDRLAFIGASGSGKTELAKFFLSRLNRVVVIDPKHTFKLDGFSKSKRLPILAKEFRIIYRPKMDSDSDLYDLILKLYKMGNVTIYVDEMATLSEMFPDSTTLLKNVARTGRERRVALWSAVQRPRGVPLVFFTECETFFVFNLRSMDDRQHVKGFVGDEVLDRIPKFKFWHCSTDSDDPQLMSLDLEKQIIRKESQNVA
jgi:DNA helicase HerA-like ATPase